jgi:hypothetical protein
MAMARHVGTTNPESGNLRSSGSAASATRPEDWDYPTTEMSAAALRAKVAELRAKRGAGAID